MNIELTNKIIEKAKSKKDGVYSLSGYIYVVKDHKFILFSDTYGNVYQRAGNFNVSIGKVDKYDIRKQLTNHLKGIKYENT